MQISISMRKNTLVVKLMGELDHHSASKAKELLEETIINRAVKNMVFDLSKLTFMDSSGIGMIIGRYKLIHALGGKVRIVCKNKHVDRLITMSGLSKLIEVYEDFDELIENL